MMFWNGNDPSGWGMALMAAGMVVFWGALITGIVLLLRPARRVEPARESLSPVHTAKQLLAERFARGDIDETEYGARLAVLQQKPSL